MQSLTSVPVRFGPFPASVGRCAGKLLLVPVLFLLLCATALAQEVVPVERAVEKALENNPEFRVFRSEVDISRSMLRQAKSPLYPQLSGKLVVPFVGRESGFYVDQMIWDFGRTGARIRARKHDLESSEHLLEGSRTALVRDVRIAYYQALSEKNRLRGAATEAGRMEWILEKTTELFSVGKKSAAQLAQAEIDLQQAKLELVSRESSYELAMLRLRHLMNDSSLGQFDIEESLVYEKINEAREELVSSALSENPEIKSLSSQRDGIRASAAENRGRFLPSVFGRAAYRFEGEGANTPAFIAGVGVRIPIFEGFARFGRLDQSKAELSRNEAQTELLKNRIVLSVGELYLETEQLEKRIGILGKSRSVSEKSLRLAEERLASGSASKIDLAEARALYEEADADYKNSIYAYKIVRLKLLSLCGKDIP